MPLTINNQELKNFYPEVINVDGQGSFYISGSSGWGLLKFSSNGSYLTTFQSTSSSGRFVIHNNTYIYLIEGPDGVAPKTVKKYLMDGTFLTNVFSVPGETIGIATDNLGALFISISRTNSYMVAKYSTNGTLINTWGQFGEGTSMFIYPKEICFFKDALFVCDYFNNRVQVFDTNGGFLRQIQLTNDTPPGYIMSYQNQGVWVASSPVLLFSSQGMYLDKIEDILVPMASDSLGKIYFLIGYDHPYHIYKYKKK